MTDTVSLEAAAAMASFSSSFSSSLSLAALVGETVMTPSGQANVIYLAVNESSPGTLLLQLCELLATTPLQVHAALPSSLTHSSAHRDTGGPLCGLLMGGGGTDLSNPSFSLIPGGVAVNIWIQ